MMGLSCLCEKKILAILKKGNHICINVFRYENKLAIPIYFSDQKLENSMDLLLVIDGDELHYVYIMTLTDLCFKKQRIKTKNTFSKVLGVVNAESSK